MEIILFLGAGASKDFGIPVTDELIKSFPNKAKNLYDLAKECDPNLTIEDFLQFLTDIENLELGSASQIIFKYFGYSRNGDEVNVSEIKDSIFQTIRETCKIDKNMIKSASETYTALFEPVVDTGISLQIFTTNYDNVIEKVCSQNQYEYDMGFSASHFEKSFVWTNSFDNYSINLYKLHGSIDWYSDEKGKIRLISDLENLESMGMSQLSTKMIYPTNFKAIYSEPFGSLFYSFHNIMRDSKHIFVIGSSFRDPDILSPLKHRMEMNKTKMWIVSPSAEKIKNMLDWKIKSINIIPINFKFKEWVKNGVKEWKDMVKKLIEEDEEERENQKKERLAQEKEYQNAKDAAYKRGQDSVRTINLGTSISHIPEYSLDPSVSILAAQQPIVQTSILSSLQICQELLCYNPSEPGSQYCSQHRRSD